MEKQTAKLVTCESGNLHIIAICPRCNSTKGGLLLATAQDAFVGITTAKCKECGQTVEYYVNTRENSAWSMEAVESKRSGVIT